jgi:hypothetical protein
MTTAEEAFSAQRVLLYSWATNLDLPIDQTQQLNAAYVPFENMSSPQYLQL